MSETRTYEYKLYLGNSIEDTSEGKATLVLTKDAQEIEIDKKICIISLNGIKFYRKIYEPGLIEAEVAIALKNTGSLPEMDKVTELLLKRLVNLTTKPDDSATETAIAENYYVYETLPQLAKNSGKASLYVKLVIYSLDKLMTLDKYCKAYVGKKLGKDILEAESLTFGFGDNSLLKAYTGELQQLKSSNYPEFIQPYLVQYNESFYDFMARTANRCGELLYFEDGQLNLGLKDAGSDTIKDYQNVTMVNYSKNVLDVDPYYRDSVKELDKEGQVKEVKDLNFEPIEKNKTGFPEEAFPEDKSHPYTYNQEEATDEYIYPLAKDKWTTLKYEMGFGTAEDWDLFKGALGKVALSIIGNELKNTMTDGAMNLLQFLENIITEWGKATAKSYMALSKTKSKKNDAHIDKQKILHKDEQKSDDKFVGFATLNQEGWITSKLYYDIRKHQIEQQKKMICIDMGASYMAVKLGEKITVEGLSGTYIIVQVEQMSNNAWTNNYREYGRDVNDVRAGSQSQIIYAIPVVTEGDKEKVYPPISVQTYREAGPQTAFVIDNNDPKYQGRVRIVYPWQTQSEAKHKALKAATLAKLGADQKVRELKVKLDNLRNDVQCLEREQELIAEYAKLSETDREAWIARMQSSIAEDEKTIEALTITADDEMMLTPEEYQAKVAKQPTLEAAKKRRDLYMAVLKRFEDGTKTPDQIVNDINTEIDNKNNEIGTTKKDLETAEKDVKTTFEDLTTAVNEFTLEMVQKATPWVRVATPSATTGGGTYFKPQMGDEVLVNYDNNNIERPYVVGSLFSKNVPTPEEANSFTCASSGLLKSASTYIVSPNGHHIAFNDPEDGSDLMAGVQGGMTAIIGKFGYKFEHLKDLAGGIHIGDRYGLYELSMSSHERKIKVRSPFGDVNIDAFTGITINAPNGDIKITGKNVEICAGNNLVLKSGLNIQPPVYSHPDKLGKGGLLLDKVVSGVAAGAVDMYASQFIDMKLIRQLTEVFLRPIEGTLQIKSNRYMKLEAGRGSSAAIPADRYTTTQKRNDVAVKGIAFMSQVVACVQYLDRTINGFGNTYKEKWRMFNEVVFSCNNKFPALLSQAEQGNLSTILVDICNKGWTFNPDADWAPQVTRADFAGKCIRPSGEVILASYGENLAKSAHDFRRFLESYNHLFDAPDVEGADRRMVDYLTETFEDRKENVFEAWRRFYMSGGRLTNKILEAEFEAKDPFGGDFKKYKRAMAAIFIAKVANDEAYQMTSFGDGAGNAFTNFLRNPLDAGAKGKFLHVHFKPTDVKEDKLDSEFHWHHFLANMQRPQNVVARRLYDILAGTIKNYLQVDEFAKIHDRKVWADRGKGTILMSDNTGETRAFDSGAFTKDTKATNGSWDALIKTLKGIK